MYDISTTIWTTLKISFTLLPFFSFSLSLSLILFHFGLCITAVHCVRYVRMPAQKCGEVWVCLHFVSVVQHEMQRQNRMVAKGTMQRKENRRNCFTMTLWNRNEEKKTVWGRNTTIVMTRPFHVRASVLKSKIFGVFIYVSASVDQKHFCLRNKY